jgi:hypothetical protein
MLQQIKFKNYRGFSEHTLPLKSETLIVGRNNAGKSTVIEGFRIASVVIERYKNLTYKPPPTWLDLPRRYRGVQPSAQNLNLVSQNMFHRYQEPPATIEVQFSAGERITVYLGPNADIYAVLQGDNDKIVMDKREAASQTLPQLSVLPQVTPLAQQETVLDPAYVRRNISTYLAP